MSIPGKDATNTERNNTTQDISSAERSEKKTRRFCCSVDVAQRCLKIFNVIFWLTGLLSIAGGLYGLVAQKYDQQFDFMFSSPMEEKYFWSGLIVVGVLVCAVGLIGCFGSKSRSKTILIPYIICVVIIILARIFLSILPSALAKVLEEDDLRTQLEKRYGQENEQTFTDAVDFNQIENHCCGLSGWSDYKKTSWAKNQTDQIVPLSCCVLKNAVDDEAYKDPQPIDKAACQKEDADKDSRNEEGCYEKIKEKHKRDKIGILAFNTVVLCLQVLALVSAICLCAQI